MTFSARRITSALASLAAVAAVATPVSASPGQPGADTNQQLVEVRQATRQYHDVDAALEAGYQADDHCVEGMGFHYVKPELVDDEVHHDEPEVLVYAPTDDGLELVAVEYLSVRDDSLFDEDFEFVPPIELYALHAWVWRGNADGVFNATNPSVSCPTH